MRAIVVESLVGPGGVAVRMVPTPTRAPGEVLVEVEALAPAFPDVLLSKGQYQVKPDLPFSPGSDFAGTVLEADDGGRFAIGDRVAGCLIYGAAAEIVSVPEHLIYPIPMDLPFQRAAAIPMNYLTAHYALVGRGHLAAGDRVLVTGASGGVGSATIQVAKALGADVFALVSRPERAEAALQAGADYVVLPEEIPLRPRDLTHGYGVDVIVDVVGGDVTNLLRMLAPNGRLMIVGFASGEIPTIKVNRLLFGNTDVRGVESSRMFQTGEDQIAWVSIMQMFAEGFIRPAVSDGGGLEGYGVAMAALESRQAHGRAIISAQH